MLERIEKAGALTLAMTLVVAGCAGGDDDGSGGSSSSTTGTTTMGTGGMGTGGMGTGAMGTGGTGGMGTGGMGTGGMGTGGMGTGGMGTGGMGGGGPTVAITFTIGDAITQAPVSGLSVCDHDNANNCQTTNAQGQATLNLPDTDVTIDYSGANYRPHLLTLRQGASSGSVTTLAISNTNVGLLVNLVGTNDDLTKGHVGSVANTAGAMAALTPASGGGPFYSDTNGLPNTNLTATTSAGTFLYTNVDPGTPEVGVTHPNLSCVTDLGVVGGMANTAEARVEAGAITIVSSFVCQ